MLKQSIKTYTALALLAVPLFSWGWQDVEPDAEKRWLSPPDERRAYVKVTNDWRDTVRLTIWTKRGVQVGDHWTIPPGETGMLRDDGNRITATAEYSIKVGDDPVATTLESVGRRRGDTWHVRVRDIWRATHERGDQSNSGDFDQR